MGRQSNGGLPYRQVVGSNQGDGFGRLVNHAAQRRTLERETDKLALGTLYPFTGDDDVTGGTGGIGVLEMVLFRKIHHRKGRLNLTVGLQRGAHADLGHIRRGNVVGGFRIIPRNGDHVTVHLRVRNLQTAHLLPLEGTEGKIGRQRSNALSFGGRSHIFGLVACYGTAGQQ